MRRSERGIKNREEMMGVLRRADTIRLGMNGDSFPYVVPLSFGFEERDGQVVIYIHGAKEGFKHTLLDRNCNVCVEAGIFHRYTETDKGGLTTLYESVIGFGEAEAVDGEEAVKGLDLICSHCGYHGFVYDSAAALTRMRVYRITLSSITGKRNL
ncbi:MAG: pyridoxamine 5'-phosphate oxidase family protein [Defluviitaleaceae bacterium]|nr:pyridoxamine 5'-phosphate oxidase family protein [Defluviitaleaceae bacterium]